MKRRLLLTALFALAAFALAQDVTFDPRAWGSDPVLALLALTGTVAWLRLTKWGAGLDGPVRVAAATGAIGIVGGAALQIGHVLTVLPFADYNSPLGGILYGLALAFTAVTGVSVFNYLGSKVRTQTITISTGELGFLAAPQNAASDFILGLVRQAVGNVKLPAGIEAVAPLLAQFAQSEAILTDELRARLQQQVLTLLRKAGLVGVDA